MVPRFADQFENARRITDARAGRTVELRTALETRSQPHLDEEHESRRIRSLWRKCCQTLHTSDTPVASPAR